nr:GNAT family N-acetyltransferase [uncultured Cohaesibacter sp.]
MLRLEKWTEAHRAGLGQIQLSEEQSAYSGSVDAFLRSDDAGAVERFVISKNDRPIGYFKIDLAYAALHPFCPVGGLGLKALALDWREQGQGLGTKVMTRLGPYLSGHYRHYHALYLMVDCRNERAMRCYFKAGFERAGLYSPPGSDDAHHVMVTPLEGHFWIRQMWQGQVGQINTISCE